MEILRHLKPTFNSYNQYDKVTLAVFILNIVRSITILLSETAEEYKPQILTYTIWKYLDYTGFLLSLSYDLMLETEIKAKKKRKNT